MSKVLIALFALGVIGGLGWGIWKLSESESCRASSTNPDIVWVNYPHVGADGTFVQGYWKTRNSNTMYDNFSSQGNVNPFTQEVGTVVPLY